MGFTKRRCVEEASGEICGFVDPDDALTEDAVEISVKSHENNCVAAYSQFYYCDENLKNIALILVSFGFLKVWFIK